LLPRWGDASGYLYLAQEWRSWGSLRALNTGIRPPLPRMLIGAGLDTSVTPYEPYPGVYLIQIAAAVLACLLLMLVTRRMFGARAAAATGWLYALYPQAVFWSSGLIMAETFAVLMGAAAILSLHALDRAFDVPGARLWPRAVLLGVVLGVGILMREQLLSVAAASGLVLLLRPGVPFMRRAPLAAAVGVIALGLTIPWARFNLKHYDLPVISGSFADVSMLIENAPPGQSGIKLWLREPELKDKVAVARKTFRRALTEYPLLTAERALFRLRVLFGPEVMLPIYFAIPFDDYVPDTYETFELYNQNWRLPAGTWGRRVQLLCAVGVVIVFALAAAGMAAARPSTLRRLALLITALIFVSIALMAGTARYRHSLLAFLLPFAGLALAALTDRTARAGLDDPARRRALRWGIGMALLLIVTLFVLPQPAIP
jgi:4-amino-4-deoxy-L-arabinose transferase-like glycosyltransferase